jgi:hypothetical protein
MKDGDEEDGRGRAKKTAPSPRGRGRRGVSAFMRRKEADGAAQSLLLKPGEWIIPFLPA